ncbi:hypothetical protein EK21DRAFT_84492 [Setomelanomma holmii]|uniref:Uncharacterized protein n=1 Tax=Setomelanomma holmii TaxID=210430 RepID=A0A9P4HIY8_9PLEO|nr:hypothetical protein EK21DRAFT_84492 [Setomelanomma holmii]
MHTMTKLISLLALAFTVPNILAIDIRMHTSSACGGNALLCSAINPGVCCSTDQGSWSIGFYGIPTNWNIHGSVYIDSSCAESPFSDGNNNGNSFMCFDAPAAVYHSAKYVFNGRRRGVVEEGCKKPDMFVLESGVRYVITGLTDGELGELIRGAENGVGLERFGEYVKVEQTKSLSLHVYNTSPPSSKQHCSLQRPFLSSLQHFHSQPNTIIRITFSSLYINLTTIKQPMMLTTISTQILFPLFTILTLTTAIDVRLFNGNNCLGPYFICGNLNPNVSCSVPPLYDQSSVGYYGIVEGWNIEVLLYRGETLRRQPHFVDGEEWRQELLVH